MLRLLERGIIFAEVLQVQTNNRFILLDDLLRLVGRTLTSEGRLRPRLAPNLSKREFIMAKKRKLSGVSGADFTSTT
jgi:hypothetical protein